MDIKEAIISILAAKKISTQEEVAQELQKQGLQVKQSTISRQFKSLGVYKALADGVVFYKVPAVGGNNKVGHFIKSVRHNEAVIVVKTNDGAANLVGDVIDKLDLPEILGVIAGDNTIFITTSSIRDIERTCKILKDRINM
uniref:Arginine repressor n=1 Tax=uncultured Alphaproteobacteria bacterium TaxID=91750 RepID=A0A6G8F389_9PROT|nr:arginine repressor [uncultured Alphaproteobacteria bacterium]